MIENKQRTFLGIRWVHGLPRRENRAPRPSHPTLNLGAVRSEPPELVKFLAEAEALHKRLEFRNPSARAEIMVLLQGAVDSARTTASVAPGDKITAARELLRRAEMVYEREVVSKNRIFYVIGLLIGVCAVVLVPIALLWSAEAMAFLLRASGSPAQSFASHVGNTLVWVVEVAPLTTTAPIFFFAGLGASASVLSRLNSIDLKEENSRAMVYMSAAARPALAVIFASVIFVILNNNIINVTADTSKPALILVAAFLCGYSERFATEILTRVPFGATAKSSPSTSASPADGAQQ